MAVWNPWHGCRKISPGCLNCYVYRRDAEFGKDASVIAKTASFDLPVRRNRKGEYKLQPDGEPVYTCMTSDFFLKEADAWLHLGWEGAGSANRQNPELQRKNIGYAMESLRTAAALGCGRFLFTGSQAEYGICREPMREDGECHPVSEYGKDKLEVCRRASAAAGALGLTYLHARVFSVYGPGDHPWSLISTCIDTYLQGGHMEMGPCTQLWNFLYVEEAARELGLKPKTVRSAYGKLKRLGIRVGQLPAPEGDTIGARLDPETYIKLQRMVTAHVDP